MKKEIAHIIQESSRFLQEKLAERLRTLILFGSYARQDATAESDIDLLVVLDDIPNYLIEYRNVAPYLQKIAFRYDKVVSIILVSQNVFEQNFSPFYRNVKREGKIII